MARGSGAGQRRARLALHVRRRLLELPPGGDQPLARHQLLVAQLLQRGAVRLGEQRLALRLAALQTLHPRLELADLPPQTARHARRLARAAQRRRPLLPTPVAEAEAERARAERRVRARAPRRAPVACRGALAPGLERGALPPRLARLADLRAAAAVAALGEQKLAPRAPRLRGGAVEHAGEQHAHPLLAPSRLRPRLPQPVPVRGPSV